VSSDAAVLVRELRKRFTVHVQVTRKRIALDGLSLDVRPGEVYGFLGPNGAGKTTTIKVLTSLLRPDSGEALLFGRQPWEPQARSRLGFLPETPVFYDHLSGREFLRLCGTLTGVPRTELGRRADAMLERVGLSHAIDLPIRRYSKGMTQRVGIAQALLHDPDLVILDEPMSGLDPMGRGDVRDLISDLRKRGKTVFFSTHIIPDVEAICDRVGIIAKGKLVRVGTVKELMSEGRTGSSEIVAQGLPETFQFSGEAESTSLSGQRLFVVASLDLQQRLLEEVSQARGTIVSVTPRQASLEDLVVRMLSGVEN
jgi:ABC-2 type transport system ATP-binding protein